MAVQIKISKEFIEQQLQNREIVTGWIDESVILSVDTQEIDPDITRITIMVQDAPDQLLEKLEQFIINGGLDTL